MKPSENILQLNYKDTELKVEIIYRKRKNITIQVKPRDEVIIISPPNVKKELLKEIIITKGDWILKKLEEFKYKGETLNEKKLINGETLYYLGEEYILQIVDIEHSRDNHVEIKIVDNKIIVKTCNNDEGYIRRELKMWYKEESQKVVNDRLLKCRDIYPIMRQLNPSTLKVKEQKKIWGSCTSKGAIYINSKIVMARSSSIDYILVHEFSHLIYMNHSREFYSLVERIMPNYKDEEEWLKKYSHKLIL